MRIAVLGATGPTGGLFVQAALNAGHTVRMLSRRRGTAMPGIELMTGDATVQADVARFVRGVDAVVSFLSPRHRRDTVRSVAAKNLAQAMSDHKVNRLVWCSAAGVGDSLEGMRRTSWVFSRVIIPLALRQQFADAARAEALLKATDLSLTLLRPVQLVDGPSHGARAASPAERVPRTTIARADLALFALEALENPSRHGQAPVIYGSAAG